MEAGQDGRGKLAGELSGLDTRQATPQSDGKKILAGENGFRSGGHTKETMGTSTGFQESKGETPNVEGISVGAARVG